MLSLFWVTHFLSGRILGVWEVWQFWNVVVFGTSAEMSTLRKRIQRMLTSHQPLLASLTLVFNVFWVLSLSLLGLIRTINVLYSSTLWSSFLCSHLTYQSPARLPNLECASKSVQTLARSYNIIFDVQAVKSGCKSLFTTVLLVSVRVSALCVWIPLPLVSFRGLSSSFWTLKDFDVTKHEERSRKQQTNKTRVCAAVKACV